MSRKVQQRAIDTRNRILAAALELFSECGFSGATMDAVALKAKANKQRIYAYFGSKQQLFEAVVLKLFADVDLFAGNEMADCPPPDLTRRLLDGFMKVHTAHPEFWRLLAWCNLDNGVQAEKLIDARTHENTMIRDIFERGVNTGVIRPMLFRNYVYALLALSWFYFSNRQTLKRTLSPELFTPSGCELLLNEVSALFAK